MFISFDVEFDNYTARVNAYNDEFYGRSSIGQITKINFSYFDNYGIAQTAAIEVYDNNPKNYALSLSNSNGRYFSKMNFLTHKGKLISITELKIQRYDGTIFIINEEDNNGKFYSIKSAGKDSVGSANLVEFDDYYDVEKDLGNESFYSYFEKENLILDAWVELLKEKEEMMKMIFYIIKIVKYY